MPENLRPQEDLPEKQEQGEILYVLERALEQRVRAELTVKEPLGNLRTNEVFIEELQEHVVYVSDSEELPVMPLLLNSVKAARLTQEKE